MDRYDAQEKKALNGGTLPIPMIWVDNGGQLPYSHVVVDVSGSMGATTFVPNVVDQKYSRLEYIMFLLREMYDSGAIREDTRIYPMTPSNQKYNAFISADFLFNMSRWYQTPEMWNLLFEPRSSGRVLTSRSGLPYTKTLLITDESYSHPSYHDPSYTNRWRGDVIAWE